MVTKYSFSFSICLLLFFSAIAQDRLNPLKGDIRVHDPVMIKRQ